MYADSGVNGELNAPGINCDGDHESEKSEEEGSDSAETTVSTTESDETDGVDMDSVNCEEDPFAFGNQVCDFEGEGFFFLFSFFFSFFSFFFFLFTFFHLPFFFCCLIFYFFSSSLFPVFPFIVIKCSFRYFCFLFPILILWNMWLTH